MVYEHQAKSFNNFRKNPGKQKNLLLVTDNEISQTIYIYLYINIFFEMNGVLFFFLEFLRPSNKLAAFGPILDLILQ